MSLEERVATLERENLVLKQTIQKSLVALQETLEREDPASAAVRWQRRAWIVAILNVVLAVTLFVNVRFFTLSDLPPTLHPETVIWLRALWVATAFIWLLVQLYPLSLLFENEQVPPRKLAWRSALRLLTSSPAITISVTGFALLITVLSVLWPTGWLWLMAVAAICIVFTGIQSAFHRRHTNDVPE